jgi:hypothetical protein
MHELLPLAQCFNADSNKKVFLQINFRTSKLECSVFSSLSTLSSPILALPNEILTISEATLVPTTIEVVS